MTKDEKGPEQTDQKKKTGGFFKSLFFDETVENAVEVTDPVASKQEGVAAPVQAQPVYVTPVYSTPNNNVGTVNQELYNNLKIILSERNLPGPDYYELKTSADAMRTYIPDENQRIIISYASIKATSPKLTKKVVVDSIDEYVNFIEKERAVAEQESAETFEEEVTNRQLEIDKLNAEIEEAKIEIQRISDNIIATTQKINVLTGEKLGKQTELDIKKKNFDITVDTIVNELKSDKIKIETLITE